MQLLTRNIPENRLSALFASAVIFACTGLIAITASDAQAQTQSLGSKYGTREPAKCASMSKPAKGPPSNAQALEYLKCTMEIETSGNLYLLQDLTVQVAQKGRPYNPRAPIRNIDTDYPVFDIRGSYVRYQCDRVYSGAGGSNVGKNCNSYDQPKAEGVCWKTTFGDWGCNMMDLNHSGSQYQKRNLAPPQ